MLKHTSIRAFRVTERRRECRFAPDPNMPGMGFEHEDEVEGIENALPTQSAKRTEALQDLLDQLSVKHPHELEARLKKLSEHADLALLQDTLRGLHQWDPSIMDRLPPQMHVAGNADGFDVRWNQPFSLHVYPQHGMPYDIASTADGRFATAHVGEHGAVAYAGSGPNNYPVWPYPGSPEYRLSAPDQEKLLELLVRILQLLISLMTKEVKEEDDDEPEEVVTVKEENVTPQQTQPRAEDERKEEPKREEPRSQPRRAEPQPPEPKLPEPKPPERQKEWHELILTPAFKQRLAREVPGADAKPAGDNIQRITVTMKDVKMAKDVAPDLANIAKTQNDIIAVARSMLPEKMVRPRLAQEELLKDILNAEFKKKLGEEVLGAHVKPHGADASRPALWIEEDGKIVASASPVETPLDLSKPDEVRATLIEQAKELKVKAVLDKDFAKQIEQGTFNPHDTKGIIIKAGSFRPGISAGDNLLSMFDVEIDFRKESKDIRNSVASAAADRKTVMDAMKIAKPDLSKITGLVVSTGNSGPREIKRELLETDAWNVEVHGQILKGKTKEDMAAEIILLAKEFKRDGILNASFIEKWRKGPATKDVSLTPDTKNPHEVVLRKNNVPMVYTMDFSKTVKVTRKEMENAAEALNADLDWEPGKEVPNRLFEHMRKIISKEFDGRVRISMTDQKKGVFRFKGKNLRGEDYDWTDRSPVETVKNEKQLRWWMYNVAMNADSGGKAGDVRKVKELLKDMEERRWIEDYPRPPR